MVNIIGEEEREMKSGWAEKRGNVDFRELHICKRFICVTTANNLINFFCLYDMTLDNNGWIGYYITEANNNILKIGMLSCEYRYQSRIVSLVGRIGICSRILFERKRWNNQCLQLFEMFIIWLTYAFNCFEDMKWSWSWNRKISVDLSERFCW